MTAEIMQLAENQEVDLSDASLEIEESGCQYLSFFVGEEEFCVNILSVQEIRAWEHPTFLPNSLSFMKGVLNLRGTIVPVIDLRCRFNFSSVEYSDKTAIIILKNVEDDRERLMGCVVDSVSDVFNLQSDEIRNVPNKSSNVGDRFTEGVMTVNNHPVTLLNLNQLLSLDLIEHPYSGGGNNE
jgi:purine-binding chemotaxis protein CheW